MPYVDKEARARIVLRVKDTDPQHHTASRIRNATAVLASEVFTPGELNFAITTLIDTYLKKRPLCYHAINEVVGVLECAKLELYRRIAAPYEDKKSVTNGDVFSTEEYTR